MNLADQHKKKKKLRLLEPLGNISEAGNMKGCSQDSRFKRLYEKVGELALQEIARRKPCLKHRVDVKVEQAVINISFEKPIYGQVKVSNELKKQGIIVSPGGVRSIWLRSNLETFDKRLKALEKKAEELNLISTEDLLKALERAKEQK